MTIINLSLYRPEGDKGDNRIETWVGNLTPDIKCVYLAMSHETQYASLCLTSEDIDKLVLSLLQYKEEAYGSD